MKETKMNNENLPVVRTDYQSTGLQLGSYLSQEDMYAVAEHQAMAEMLYAGLANNVINYAKYLAASATDGINMYPEFKEEFKFIVGEFVLTSSDRLYGRR